MKKLILFLFLLIYSLVYSQNISKKEHIKNTIHLFFEGLQNGDTITVNKTIHKNFRGLTTYINSNGNSVIADEVSKKEFLNIISSKNPTDSWFEKLISFSIEVDNNLANVWTPYKFYLNNNLSHCGSNSFQLVQINNNWKIVSVIDTRRRENCN